MFFRSSKFSCNLFFFRQDEEIKTMARELEIQSQITTAAQVFIYIRFTAASNHLNDSQSEFRVFDVMLSTFSGGVMASWLVRSPPDRAVWVRALTGGIALCSWARHFASTVPLSTQVYEWVLANRTLCVTL